MIPIWNLHVTFRHFTFPIFFTCDLYTFLKHVIFTLLIYLQMWCIQWLCGFLHVMSHTIHFIVTCRECGFIFNMRFSHLNTSFHYNTYYSNDLKLSVSLSSHAFSGLTCWNALSCGLYFTLLHIICTITWEKLMNTFEMYLKVFSTRKLFFLRSLDRVYIYSLKCKSWRSGTQTRRTNVKHVAWSEQRRRADNLLVISANPVISRAKPSIWLASQNWRTTHSVGAFWRLWVDDSAVKRWSSLLSRLSWTQSSEVL